MPRSTKDTLLSGPYGGPCSLKSARDRALQVEVFELQSKNYEASKFGKVAPYPVLGVDMGKVPPAQGYPGMVEVPRDSPAGSPQTGYFTGKWCRVVHPWFSFVATALKAGGSAGIISLLPLVGILWGVALDLALGARKAWGMAPTSRGRARATFVAVVLLLWYLPLAEGAPKCIHCKDRFDPFGHASDVCPTLTVVAANVAAVAAGTYLFEKLDKILPTYVLRLFPRAALRALGTLCSTPNPGGSYDFFTDSAQTTPKDLAVICRDYQSGLFTKDEAMVVFTPMLVAKGDGADDTKAFAQAAMSFLKACSVPTPVDTVGVFEGRYRYILNRVSEYAVTTPDTTGWLRVADEVREAKEAPGSSHSSTWLKAKPFIPTQYHQFFHMLNLWVMVLHATGLDNAIATTQFLQDVVYDSLAEGMHWSMVYCLLVVYLTSVEKEDGVTLGNVSARGGRDDKKAKAARIHAEIYGNRTTDNHLFASRGQSARGPGNTSASAKRQWCPHSKIYFNPQSRICCHPFNNEKDHKPDNLAADGGCTFLHRCNALVTDDEGKRTKCMGNHPATQCNNPKRVSA